MLFGLEGSWYAEGRSYSLLGKCHGEQFKDDGRDATATTVLGGAWLLLQSQTVSC